MSVEPISIIIVEDDQVLRESIGEYLTLAGYQVTGAGTGREFYRALDHGSYTIAIIDVGLPDQSGLVLADYLRDNTNMGIIILTARVGEEDQHKGYQAGADLYMTKPVSVRVLASAVGQLASRLTKFPVAIPREESSCWVLDQALWTLTSPQNGMIDLTSMEMEFLKLLVQLTGSVITRECLIKQLYPNRIDDYSGRALDALVRRLREKISCITGKANPVKSSYGVGFSFAEPVCAP